MKMSNTKKIKAIKLLKDLISIPSISGKEHPAGEYISNYLKSIGLSPIRHEVYKGGSNIIVEIGSGKRSVLIESHMDVVPAWDMENAFTPIVEDGMIRGRGACDTKGGLVSTLLALEELVKRENELNDKLIFAYVVDEEYYGRGAKELLIRGVKADYGIIIEPTNLTLSISVAGCIEFLLESYGVSGHGASPFPGNNAIKNLILLLNRFETFPLLDEKGDLRYMKNILNIGKIRGGESAWMIPSYAEAELLLHFIPSHTFSEVLEMITRFVKDKEEEIGGVFNLRILHGCEGYMLDRNDEFISHLESVARSSFSKDNILSHMPSESDANELYHKGGIKAVVFGPGDINVAHSSIEYIKVEDILKASEFLFKSFTT